MDKFKSRITIYYTRTKNMNLKMITDCFNSTDIWYISTLEHILSLLSKENDLIENYINSPLTRIVNKQSNNGCKR